MSPQKLSNSPPNAPPPAPPVRNTFDASPEWVFNCFLSDRWLPRCRWCQTGTLPMEVAWPGRPTSSRRRTITMGCWRRFSQVCGEGINGWCFDEGRHLPNLGLTWHLIWHIFQVFHYVKLSHSKVVQSVETIKATWWRKSVTVSFHAY